MKLNIKTWQFGCSQDWDGNGYTDWADDVIDDKGNCILFHQSVPFDNEIPAHHPILQQMVDLWNEHYGNLPK